MAYYNPDVINPGGIDYAEVDNLVNPPNPANAGKAIVIGEGGKPTLGEGGGGGGINVIEIPITNILPSDVQDELERIYFGISEWFGNTKIGYDMQQYSYTSADNLTVPLFGEKAVVEFFYGEASENGFVVDSISATGDIIGYFDEDLGNWTAEITGEGTLTITWNIRD